MVGVELIARKGGETIITGPWMQKKLAESASL